MYVTHDQEEAFSVADGSSSCATGASRRRHARGPLVAAADAWAAGFLGFRNVAEADIHAGTADSPWGALPLAGQPDGAVTLVLRPEALTLAATGPIEGTVSTRRFHGDHVRVIVDTVAGAALELEVRAGGLPELDQRVFVVIDPERINILRPPG